MGNCQSLLQQCYCAWLLLLFADDADDRVTDVSSIWLCSCDWAMSCRARWTCTSNCSPWATTSSSCLAASWFSCSRHCKLASCTNNVHMLLVLLGHLYAVMGNLMFWLCFLCFFSTSPKPDNRPVSKLEERLTFTWKKLRPNFSNIQLGVLEGGAFHYIYDLKCERVQRDLQAH